MNTQFPVRAVVKNWTQTFLSSRCISSSIRRWWRRLDGFKRQRKAKAHTRGNWSSLLSLEMRFRIRNVNQHQSIWHAMRISTMNTFNSSSFVPQSICKSQWCQPLKCAYHKNNFSSQLWNALMKHYSLEYQKWPLSYTHYKQLVLWFTCWQLCLLHKYHQIAQHSFEPPEQAWKQENKGK